MKRIALSFALCLLPLSAAVTQDCVNGVCRLHSVMISHEVAHAVGTPSAACKCANCTCNPCVCGNASQGTTVEGHARRRPLANVASAVRNRNHRPVVRVIGRVIGRR